MLIITTIDLRHKIDLIGFGIKRAEDEDSYWFFISSLLKSYKLIEKRDYNPQYFMSDGYKSI